MIEVEEEGTVAAAATVYGIVGTSASREPVPIKFIANHPFLFFLRDLQTGLLLFQGRMVNPQK